MLQFSIALEFNYQVRVSCAPLVSAADLGRFSIRWVQRYSTRTSTWVRVHHNCWSQSPFISKVTGATEVFDYHSPVVVDDIVQAVNRRRKPFHSAVDAISLPSSPEGSIQVLQKAANSDRDLAIVLSWPESIPKPEGLCSR